MPYADLLLINISVCVDHNSSVCTIFTAHKPSSLWNGALNFSAKDLAQNFYFDTLYNIIIFYHNMFITDDITVYITKRVNVFITFYNSAFLSNLLVMKL